MGQISDKIRAYISEGELPQAIDVLVEFLKGIGGDLYNQAIFLKGDYKEYTRSKNLGLGAHPSEKSRISMAVLELASEIDAKGLENPKPNYETPKPQLQSNQPVQNQPVQNQPVQNQPYYAQCIFNNDMLQYYVMKDNGIYAYNPVTLQWMGVGMKMPSNDFRFSWMIYFSATNIYYGVDQNGSIWGQNWMGPLQMGYVRYF